MEGYDLVEIKNIWDRVVRFIFGITSFFCIAFDLLFLKKLKKLEIDKQKE